LPKKIKILKKQVSSVDKKSFSHIITKTIPFLLQRKPFSFTQKPILNHTTETPNLIHVTVFLNPCFVFLLKLFTERNSLESHRQFKPFVIIWKPLTGNWISLLSNLLRICHSLRKKRSDLSLLGFNLYHHFEERKLLLHFFLLEQVGRSLACKSLFHSLYLLSTDKY
jgi:hypothetical protein